VQGKVAEVAEVSDEAGLVGFTWNVVNQDERTVCRARVEVLWKRDTQPASSAGTGGQAAVGEDEYAATGFVPIPL
jgi:hypothetical protein